MKSAIAVRHAHFAKEHRKNMGENYVLTSVQSHYVYLRFSGQAHLLFRLRSRYNCSNFLPRAKRECHFQIKLQTVIKSPKRNRCSSAVNQAWRYLPGIAVVARKALSIYSKARWGAKRSTTRPNSFFRQGQSQWIDIALVKREEPPILANNLRLLSYLFLITQLQQGIFLDWVN